MRARIQTLIRATYAVIPVGSYDLYHAFLAGLAAANPRFLFIRRDNWRYDPYMHVVEAIGTFDPVNIILPTGDTLEEFITNRQTDRKYIYIVTNYEYPWNDVVVATSERLPVHQCLSLLYCN